MSLSCTESTLIDVHHAGPRHAVLAQPQQLMAELKSVAVEATLSTHVASVLLRVVASMALGFALVRLLKFYIA